MLIFDVNKITKIFDGEINFRNKVIIKIEGYKIINIKIINADDIALFFKLYDIYNFDIHQIYDLFACKNKIDISCLNIKRFPDINIFKNLENLFLNSNNLETFYIHKDLNVLSLSYNPIKDFPNFKYNVKTLYLDSCRINEINNINFKIDKLSIMSNNLTSIYLENVKLDNLLLSDNKIKKFTFINVNIKTLILDSCSLYEFPNEITDIQNLTYLSLNYNFIRYINNKILKLNNLVQLHLHLNKIKTLAFMPKNLKMIFF
jgi:Leucine-rich repeat (LRR) protein